MAPLMCSTTIFFNRPFLYRCLQHVADKDRSYKGALNKQPCVDLMIVDMLEGLPVPGLSIPATSIPRWNHESTEWLQPIFDFADQHVQDDGALIIIHPFRLPTKSKILGYCESYGFEVRKEWWGMNRLHLAKPENPSLTVRIVLKYFVLFNFS